MTVTPFSTITLRASPDGDRETFTDSDSINAESVRVYNSGTIEAFISFGDDKVTACSFPIPPKESILLSKGNGIDTVSAITESGSATIRITAIEEKKGSDVMTSLEMVSVLRDAMGNQKIIDTAVKKITDATDKLNTKKEEVSQAAKVIANAKLETSKLEKTKSDVDLAMRMHDASISAFNLAAKKTKEDIESKKTEAATAYADKCAEISEIQKKIDDDKLSLSFKESEIQSREIALAANEDIFAKEKINHEIDKKKLADKQANYDEAFAKFEARKKKLAEATKED